MILNISLQVQEIRGILDSEVLVTSCIMVWGVPLEKILSNMDVTLCGPCFKDENTFCFYLLCLLPSTL